MNKMIVAALATMVIVVGLSAEAQFKFDGKTIFGITFGESLDPTCFIKSPTKKTYLNELNKVDDEAASREISPPNPKFFDKYEVGTIPLTNIVTVIYAYKSNVICSSAKRDMVKNISKANPDMSIKANMLFFKPGESKPSIVVVCDNSSLQVSYTDVILDQKAIRTFEKIAKRFKRTGKVK